MGGDENMVQQQLNHSKECVSYNKTNSYSISVLYKLASSNVRS